MRAAGSPAESAADGRPAPDAETGEWIRALRAGGAEDLAYQAAADAVAAAVRDVDLVFSRTDSGDSPADP